MLHNSYNKMLKFLIALYSMDYMYSFEIKELSTNFLNTIVENSRRVSWVHKILYFASKAMVIIEIQYAALRG